MKNTPLKTSSELSSQIFIRPGPAHTVESKPETLPAECVPKVLRECHFAEQKYQAEAEEAQAKLAAARAAAMEIQEAYEVLCQTRDAWQGEINQGEGRKAEAAGHMARIESETEAIIGDRRGLTLQDHANESVRHLFLLDRIEPWLKVRKEKLAKLEIEISEFRKLHGISR